MPGVMGARQREKRWLVITETGHHGTISRMTDPTTEQIANIADTLVKQGIAAWLVGRYYSRDGAWAALIPTPSPLRGRVEPDDAVGPTAPSPAE